LIVGADDGSHLSYGDRRASKAASHAVAEFYCLLSRKARETSMSICNEASPRQPERLYRRGFMVAGSLSG